MLGPLNLPKSAEWLAVTYLTGASTVCRICHVRNHIDTPVVTIVGPGFAYALSSDPSKEKPLRLVTAVCLTCYNTLRDASPSGPHAFKLPSLASLKLRDRYDDGSVYQDLTGCTFDTAARLLTAYVKQLHASYMERDAKSRLAKRESELRIGKNPVIGEPEGGLP